MDLTIEQSCPSCGAPITLHEADRLLKCPYCDVGNYLVEAGISRFVLPDKAPESIAREDLMYVPYLRFKGNIYSCRGREVDHKVVDTTHQGMPVASIPVSLGLRPQAMNIFPVTGAIAGRFLRQKEKPSAVFAKAVDLASLVGKESIEPLYHRAFIGETISCIYLPVYIRDGDLVDAVLNRSLGPATSLEVHIPETMRYKPAWSPRFLATICPHCAGVLDGEHDSLVLSCPNCETLWSERKGKFEQVRWQILRSGNGEDNGLHLPFWKIKPKVNGITLESFGDFLRLTNQPMVITREHDEHDLSFWVPAFKIRPKFFLQLAKSMTLSQNRIPAGTTDMAGKMYPVTLPASEACQSVKTVLANITLDKRHLLPKLPSITFQVRETDLVYLPFDYSGHDLVQEQTNVCVSSTVLEFGRTL
jgi:predicted RNA-binding Zn-ribbon protein involved in translation (DUF1610 family)